MSYANISAIIKVGEVSDYSDELFTRNIEDAYTLTRCERFDVNCLAGVAKTIDFGVLFATAIKSIVVYNKGTANYVGVLVTGADGACNQRVPYGEFIRLTDATIAGDITLTANTTDAVVEVIVFGT